MSFESWGEMSAPSPDDEQARRRINPMGVVMMIVGGALLVVSLYVKTTAPVEQSASDVSPLQYWGWIVGAVVGITLLMLGRRVCLNLSLRPRRRRSRRSEAADLPGLR